MGADPELRSRVFAWIEDRREELFGSLQEIVRVPSVVGDEGTAQEYVATLLAEMGLEVERLEADLAEVAKHPAYIETPWPTAGRPNVIGTMPGTRDGRSLILNAHIDVVSPEPLDRWSHDPWEAEIADGRMYGRGAGDTKGGFVAYCYALQAIFASGARPRGRVLVETVVEEEAGGGAGTLACLLAGYHADAALVSEPVNLGMVLSHSGVYYFRVRVIGKTAHAGFAHDGVNAIGKMYTIYRALVELDRRRAKEHRYPPFEAAWGRSCHLNPGTLKAGDWPSTVPGFAEMECRISFVPGESGGDVRREVEETVAAACEGDEWLRDHPASLEWFGWHGEPWEQRADAAFVRAFQAAAAHVLASRPEPSGVSFGADTRLFDAFGIPSVCFGAIAGNIHGADEWVDLDSIVATTKVTAATVLEWCGHDER